MKKRQIGQLGIVLLLSGLVLACSLSSSPQIPPQQQTATLDVSQYVAATLTAIASREQETVPIPTQEVDSTSPTPEVAPLPLPFSDDFDSGLRSEWRIVSGQPVISQGRLTAIPGQTLVLEIGDARIQNYIVECDFVRGKQWASLVFLPNPNLKILIQHWGGYGDGKVIWETYDNGEWLLIKTTYIQLPEEGALKMEMRPPQYTLYIDGEIVDSTIFESGGGIHSALVVKLQHTLSDGVHFSIDNFVIRE